MEWFELKRHRGADGVAAAGVQFASNVLFQYLLIHDFDDATFTVVGIKGSDDSHFTARNCIIYDGDAQGIRTNALSAPRNTATIDNCTIYGIGKGVDEDEGIYTVTNTISMGNVAADFDVVRGTQSYNLSEFATAAGPGSLINKVPSNQFVSLTVGSEDFHLKAGADAIDAGTDLSPAFAIDIDAQLRPWGAQWDMGADERPTANSCPVTQQAWFDQDWQFRKAIVVQSSKVTAVLTDFPVLINLASDTELAADAQNNGNDIVFTSSDGVTKLRHEIEKFDGVTGALVAWIKVPYLSSGADTTIYMYYGNGTVGNQQDVPNVWDSNYKGVWHLKEEQAGTGGVDVYQDSTVNANHGDDHVSATGQTGQVDGGQEFDGSDDYIDAGTATSLDMGSGDFSLEAWLSTVSPSNRSVGGKGATDAGGTRYYLEMTSGADCPSGALKGEIDDNSTKKLVCSSSTSLDDGGWHHVAVMRDGNNLRLYTDGAESGNSPTDITAYGNLDSIRPFTIASLFREDFLAQARFFAGFIDEVRVSSTARSADWIATEYNNQWDPPNFYNVCSATTEVELVSFEALGLDEAVELSWETASELNNLGFQLYRSTSEVGSYKRITSNAIPGLGSSPVGARYSYRDTNLTNGVTYYYKLEDVETTGNTEFHGPVSATPEAGTSSSGGDSGDSSSNSSSDGSSSGEDSDTSVARITYGDPSANTLTVLRRGRGQVVLELRTEGFYAEPQEDGSVRLEIPGFEALTEANAPGIPVKRTWVEAIAGRKVKLVSVMARGVEAFTSLRPSDADMPEIVATREGTVRAARRRSRRSVRRRERAVFQGEGLYPSASARVVSVGFQGEVKKATSGARTSALGWNEGAAVAGTASGGAVVVSSS